jgi:hypothetical protein
LNPAFASKKGKKKKKINPAKKDIPMGKKKVLDIKEANFDLFSLKKSVLVEYNIPQEVKGIRKAIDALKILITPKSFFDRRCVNKGNEANDTALVKKLLKV